MNVDEGCNLAESYINVTADNNGTIFLVVSVMMFSIFSKQS